MVWLVVWYGVSAFKHLGKVRCSSHSRSGFALTLQPPGLAQPAIGLRAYALAREKSLSYHHISILSILHKNLMLYNIASLKFQNQWLEDEIPFGKAYYQGIC